ncbi:CHAT domain-containing protein [Rhizoctonia solani]|nr:CHAT domain-containing protein [Rhizoctonia solani]
MYNQSSDNSMDPDTRNDDTGHSHETNEVHRSEVQGSTVQTSTGPSPEAIKEENVGMPQVVNKPPEVKCEDNLGAWKLLMKNQLRELDAKIKASTSPEDFVAVDSNAKSILQQLAQTKALPPNTDGRRELGLSLLESLSNIILSNLIDLQHSREYLDIACYCLDQALTFLSHDRTDAADWLLNLAKCFQLRFEVAGTLEDIDNAIFCMSKVLAMTSPGHPKQLRRIESLGIAYQRRWTRLFKSEDINKAMEHFSWAFALAPEGSAEIPTLHIRMSELFFTWSQADKRHEVEGLEKAIESQTSAIALLAEEDKRLPGYLHKLGRSYHHKFKRLGKQEDIKSAIDMQTKALQLTPQEDIARLNIMHDLGDSYQTRFAFLGDLGDCSNALKFHAQAVSLTPEGHSNMATYLASLGNSYMEQFSHTGDKHDLDKAIEYQSRAVSLTPLDDRNLPGRLNNLGLSYNFKFQSFGKLEDIDKAIELQESANVLLTKARRIEPALLGNLGDSFQSRFSRLQGKSDIQAAIDLHTRAVDITPDDHPIKPGLLHNLGIAYEFRFRIFSKLHNLNDINKAIEFKARAVKLAPENHTKRATFLNDLGLGYQNRFSVQGLKEDSVQGIEYLSQAVTLTPDSHRDKPGWLTNLGNAYSERFRTHKQLYDFQRAAEALSQALSLAKEEHFNIPITLDSLAFLYNYRFEQSGNQEALDNAIIYLQKSIKSSGSHMHTVQTFKSARVLARILSLNNRPGFINAYQLTMDCLPRVIWLGEVANTRISRTFQLSDLVEEAVAAAIRAQEVSLALEWLEQGRSIVWGQFLQLKVPLDDLALLNPELATQLAEAADELHNASTGIIAPQPFEPNSYIRSLSWGFQRLHQVADHYEKLLDQVRQISGFENFLRPKKASELVKSARSGPVVSINVHKSRCDALILLPNEMDILHVPLSNLYERKALNLHVPFEVLPQSSQSPDELEGFRGVRPKVAKGQYESMLGELWMCVAKPVLEALRISTDQPLDEPVHIIWNTTGPLSLLPLHAAGDYATPRMRLFEFAVSSYTPMLGVLLRVNSPPSMHTRILVVGQETTPGQAPLPGTKLELEYIRSYAKEPIHHKQLDGHNATVPAVVSGMEEHDWVHLACHAFQLLGGPLGSSFRLHEGNLELMQIMQKKFRNKGLAFLSACHTAAGEERVSNESAHIASGMFIAGYPSVIATMWAIADKDAPLVADQVYSRLIKDGKMNYKESARALHLAIRELREKVGEKAFTRWAPFIHIGS